MESASPTNSRSFPNSSSVLLALSCLTPPSPILVPSQISSSFSSGDILIFLDRSIVDGLTCPESPSTISQETIPQSFSTATVGTFGVRRRNVCQDSVLQACSSEESGISNKAHSQDEQDSRCPDRTSYFGSPTSSEPALAEATQADDITSRNTYDDYMRVSASPALSTPSLYTPSHYNSGNVAVTPSRSDATCPKRISGLGPESLPHENSHDLSSPGECHRPLFPAASITGAQVDSALQDLHSAPSSPKIDQTVPRRRSDTSFTVNSARQSQHLDSTSLKGFEPHNYPKFSFLPEHLYWLKDIKIELLIDQEGFRSIRPAFHLAGYSSQSRSSRSRDSSVMDPGVAQFMPIRRQAFIFHYAPFDSPPVLRRLTVNGDESHDYISRQASLSMKSIGVYTVRGTETSLTPAPPNHSASNHGSEAMKINWQFDYMVSDRRVNSRCKFIDGERTFTPLTFSCSPALLNALQGKKVRLMQVVRKNVVPKLIAEKMEPPKLPSTVPAAPLNILEAITWPFEGIHKRAHSYVHRRAGNQELAGKVSSRVGPNSSSLDARLAKAEIRGANSMVVEPTRRRRASSAGERSRVAASDFRSQYIDNPDERTRLGLPPLPVSNHILPRSQLCALMSDMEDQASVAPRNHLGIQALTPRGYRPTMASTRN